MRRCLALIAFLLPMPLMAEACGREEPACETPLGSYRIALPDTPKPETGYPALFFFHGAGGTGARTLSNTGMVDRFRARGYAVVAPDGLPRPNSRFGPGWSFHPEREKQRDERAFTAEVIADAAREHGIDAGRILLSGFSIGGSLTWYLACEDPGLARAYAPVGGAFWRPHPEIGSCAGPIHLLHTHGWRDRVVPLEGRPLGGGQIYQGDVHYGFQILRDLNGCAGLRADVFDTDGTFWRRSWEECGAGMALEFALHTGGHTVPIGWSDMAIDWFEALPQTD
ncbi:MAG: dienelactone hydrolase family protein [Pseudomonadota bacterium]